MFKKNKNNYKEIINEYNKAKSEDVLGSYTGGGDNPVQDADDL